MENICLLTFVTVFLFSYRRVAEQWGRTEKDITAAKKNYKGETILFPWASLLKFPWDLGIKVHQNSFLLNCEQSEDLKRGMG